MQHHQQVADPYLADVTGFGWQALQPHQDAALRCCEERVRRLEAIMRARRGRGGHGGGSAASANGSGTSNSSGAGAEAAPAARR